VTVSGIGATLAPGTLYFLAIGCNGSLTLEGVVGPGGLSGPLVGVARLSDTVSGIVSSSWTYTASLSPFPSPSRVSGAWVPNVYAQP
jgi:hypothetical protein